MRLTMKERKKATAVVAARYQKSRKKEKGVILDEFTKLTGYGVHEHNLINLAYFLWYYFSTIALHNDFIKSRFFGITARNNIITGGCHG